MAHRFVNQPPLRSRRIVAALVGVAHLAIAADLHAQTEAQKDRIWRQADPAIKAYMAKSGAAIGEGFGRAYTSFGRWYTETLLPALDNDPPIVKVAKLVLTKGLKQIKLLPGVGQLTGLAIDVFVGVFEAATDESVSGASTTAFLSRLQSMVAEARANTIDLAERFERERPSDFEDGMFAYLREEVATPGIHDASEFDIGAGTRKKLVAFGFMEPSKTGVEQLAEPVLASMIFTARKQYFPDPAGFLDDSQRMIAARIEARRLLFPNDLARICKDASRLGMLAPKDCR